jgi:putative DNA primase/helicase
MPTAHFLRTLFDGKPDDTYVLVWALAGKRSDWFRSLPEAAAFAVGKANLYVGLGLSPHDYGPALRCEAERVMGIPGLWVDLDVEGPGHKPAAHERLLPSKDAARDLLYSLPLAPSLVVDSGHGLQAYWLFKELWLFDDDTERQQAAGLVDAWQATIRVKANGYKVDSIGDLARVLRIPGTVNHKPGCDPLPVLITDENDTRYNPSEFEPFLVTPPSTATPSRPDAPQIDDLATLGREVQAAARALAVLAPARCDDYFSWVNVGMALSELGMMGLLLWEQWSQGSTKYQPGACAAKWTTFQPGAGITLASLQHWAQEDLGVAGAVGAPPALPPPAPALPQSQPTPDDQPEHLTDLGNALRLVRLYGQNMRYVAAWGWLVWDGKRWARDDAGQVMRWAKATALSLYGEASELIWRADKELKAAATADAQGDLVEADKAKKRAEKLTGSANKVASWAHRSQARRQLEAMVALAQSELGVVARADQFDADPWLFNCNNGTINLRTGALQAHQREDLITKLSPVAYDPLATHPVWEKYIAYATQGREGLAEYLQRACGYALTGEIKQKVVFLLLGPNDTGKTTLVEAMLAMMGDYARKTSVDTFLSRKYVGGARPDLAALAGVRFVAAVEAEATREIAAATVKELSGGDRITCRELFKPEFTFQPQCKLLLAANEAPKIPDQDVALWERLRRLPFEHVIPMEDRDPEVKATLCDPETGGAALLAWAVLGCLQWQQVGLGYPDSIRSATAALRQTMDPLQPFLDAYCVLDANSYTPASELRQAYEQWAKENGERRLISSKEWGERLRAKGCESKTKRDSNRAIWVWSGIGLLIEPEQSYVSPKTDDPYDAASNVRASDDVRAVRANSNNGPRENGEIEQMALMENAQNALTKPDALTSLHEPLPAGYTGPATWHNQDHDEPVTVTGLAGSMNGLRYYVIAESKSGIPEDELSIRLNGHSS